MGYEPRREKHPLGEQWNILTDDIKESTNLVIFKKKCKDMTLEKYRCNSIDDASQVTVNGD